jgi:hypothetical protein
MSEYEWGGGRCPCCRKKAETVIGPCGNRTARGWDNLLTRERASLLARDGSCPWCGRQTTTPARTLVGRFEPSLRAYARELGW